MNYIFTSYCNRNYDMTTKNDYFDVPKFKQLIIKSLELILI